MEDARSSSHSFSNERAFYEFAGSQIKFVTDLFATRETQRNDFVNFCFFVFIEEKRDTNSKQRLRTN